jgi:preprotein translocase subunit YajC
MTKLIALFSSIMSANAFAQDSAPAAQANPIMQFLPLVVVFIIFYFMMIRPQKKKFDEEQTLLKSLAKGDEVYTKSGIIGTIYGINDKVVDLEVQNGVRFKILKGQIAGLAKSVLETESK